jgi:hypothetical protein
MLSKSAVAARLAELRSHGVRVQYADPAEAYDMGRAYLPAHHVSAYEYERDMPFAIIPGASDGRHYQADFIDNSNFRSLERDFGSAVVRIGYSGCDGLGVFVHSVSDELIRVICGLVDYAIYDESDLSELESDEITESWSWLSSDVYRQLPEPLQDLYFDMGEECVRDEFWSLVSQSDYYPECAGGEVVWDMDKAEKFVVTAIRNKRRAELGRPALAV